MRFTLILMTAGLMWAASGNAQAAHRHGGFIGPPGYVVDHYDRRGFRGRHRSHRSYRSHRRAKYLVGGLVAAAVVGHVINRVSHRRSAPRQSRPANRERGGHYLRDRYGDCFWIEVDPSGAETRTELDAAECDW